LFNKLICKELSFNEQFFNPVKLLVIMGKYFLTLDKVTENHPFLDIKYKNIKHQLGYKA